MKASTIFNKIFNRVLISFLILSIILGVSVTIILNQLLTKDLISFGKIINHNIASSIEFEMATLDLSEFQTLINRLSEGTEINYIYITDDQYKVIIDTFSPKPPDLIDDYLLNKKKDEIVHMDGLNSLQIKEPILYGSLGHVFIGMNKGVIQTKLLAILPKIFFSIPILFGLCLLLLYKVIKQITHPLQALTQFTKNIETSNFAVSNTDVAPIEQLTVMNDEIGIFSKSYLGLYRELDHHIKKMVDASAAHSAIEKELAIASSIQHGLLNATPSTNYPEALEFSTYFKSAKNIGGDFYDVIEKGNLCYFVIGDVSGKGVPAALIASTMLSNIRLACQFLDAPIDIVTAVNQEFCKHNKNTVFVTLFFGMLNIETGELDYINAGHASPYVVSNQSIKLESTKDPVIGVSDHYFYTSNQQFLNQETTLILSTDGLEEAHNNTNELFGEHKIKELLSQLDQPSAKECVDTLVNHVHAFTNGHDQHDDIAILCLQYKPTQVPIPNPLIISFQNDIEELKKLQQVVGIFSKQYNLTSDTKNSINLVLEELLSNTIFYGFNDNNPHFIYVKLEHLVHRVMVRVEDDGRPFNPLKDAPETSQHEDIQDQPVGGLGINIVRNMVSDIAYHRMDNKNVVTITKELT